MKKILLVFGSLERAGAQLRILEVCHALRQRHSVQFDFCVLGRGPVHVKTEIVSIGGTIHFTPIRSPYFAIQFSNLLKKENYDVVHSTLLFLSGVIVWLAQKNHVPARITQFHNMVSASEIPNPVYIWLMRTLIKRNSSHILAVSYGALNSTFPSHWQSSCNCKVIYNGQVLSPFQGQVERREVREEFGLPLDCQIVVNVAHFSGPKNHETILAATRLAYEHNRNIRLLLVGSGRLQNEVTRLIDQYNLKDICVMAGVRTDVPRLLLASDVFLFPSLWEGLPGGPLEALAAGLPVVASDISPIQEIAQYFPFSILMASPTNAKKHAEHILTMLERPINRDLAQANFAETPFGMKNTVEAYSHLYGLS